MENSINISEDIYNPKETFTTDIAKKIYTEHGAETLDKILMHRYNTIHFEKFKE
jgi:hypothetical protein|tara:strand:- start:2222 stop:2383 length:162 start_codon:yes stop_codon:yes gene_type:complete